MIRLCVALLLLVTPLSLQAARKFVDLGKFGDWFATKVVDGNDVHCYMHTRPKSSKGDYTKRGEVALLVTHNMKEKQYNIVEVQAGYPYHSKKPTTMSVDKEVYHLFTDNEGAWNSDPLSDKKMTKALLKGSKAKVVGYSRRGTRTEDIFSLKGSLAAFKAICKACKVKSSYTS